jgi:hypothetical protein
MNANSGLGYRVAKLQRYIGRSGAENHFFRIVLYGLFMGIPGFRPRNILLVTTLLDPLVYPAAELAQLYLWALVRGTVPPSYQNHPPGGRTQLPEPGHARAGNTHAPQWKTAICQRTHHKNQGA